MSESKEHNLRNFEHLNVHNIFDKGNWKDVVGIVTAREIENRKKLLVPLRSNESYNFHLLPSQRGGGNVK